MLRSHPFCSWGCCSAAAPPSRPKTPSTAEPAGGTTPIPGDGGFSVAGSLELLPLLGAEEKIFTISAADLDEATRLAGIERPASGDVDALVDWTQVVAGLFANASDWGGSALLPEALAPTELRFYNEVAGEFGFSLWEATHFVELSEPPLHFAVVAGELDEGSVEGTLGLRENGLWSIGGEDFRVDLADRTTALPWARGCDWECWGRRSPCRARRPCSKG